MSQLSIKELIDRLDHGAASTEVAKNDHLLWRSGVLNLSNHNEPPTVSNRLLSLKNFWFWILTVIIAMTPLIVFYVSESPFVYLRYFLASLYVLFLPGSMLVETLYPKREDLEPLERLGLSIGLSLVIVVLTGFILNLSPWGIELTSTTLSLAIITESLGIAALIRKNNS